MDIGSLVVRGQQLGNVVRYGVECLFVVQRKATGGWVLIVEGGNVGWTNVVNGGGSKGASRYKALVRKVT